MGREEEIRLIANRLWKEGGGGDGHEFEHWLKAEAIWEKNQTKIGVVLRSRFKRILKASAIISAFIFVLGFVPQFLLLLLNIDDPLVNNAIANFALGGLVAFIMCFIALMIILSIIVTLVAAWRLIRPKKAKVDRHESKGLKPPPQTQVLEPSPVRIISARAITTIGGISGFVYFMYYIGRAYSDGYSAVLGIPLSLMHYEVQDYVYFGAQIETIWITLAFTAILVGFLVTWFRQYSFVDKPIVNKMAVGVLVYMVLYGVALLLFAMFQVFRPDLVVEKAFIVTILMSCIFLFGVIILLIFFEPETFGRIRIGKIKRKIFITVAIITLLIAPYMSGKAWGAFKGQIVRITDFPKVELYTAREIIDDIKWVSIDNITFRSDQELYLVGKTNEFVFLKTSDNTSNTYILKLADVLSTKILNPGKPK